jgi:hypothetical protein
MGASLRFEAEASGFPEDFSFDLNTVEETWDYVKIGEATFLLPVSAEVVSLFAHGNWSRVSLKFKNHRHFDASTIVIFH